MEIKFTKKMLEKKIAMKADILLFNPLLSYIFFKVSFKFLVIGAKKYCDEAGYGKENKKVTKFKK